MHQPKPYLSPLSRDGRNIHKPRKRPKKLRNRRSRTSGPNLRRGSPWDFCTAKYLRPSRGRKNNEICGKHFFFRQITHTLCMGAIGFEHERVTTAESPNGPWGRNFAATPPPRVGRHRNQPIITSVGQCDAWGGAGRSSICQVGFCGAGWHIFSVYWSAGGSYFSKIYTEIRIKTEQKT